MSKPKAANADPNKADPKTPQEAPAAAPSAATATSSATARQARADDVPPGYWQRPDGSLMPASKVSELDKARDQVVRDLVAAARSVSGEISRFKSLALSEIQQFTELSAARYGVTLRGAAGKGNVTLMSYDGRFKVERQIADRITFDERLQVAKAGIDACIRRWSKGSNDHIKALVNRAFSVDKAGKVSVGKVLDLKTVEIDDAEWLAAMKALTDSVQTISSVAYIRFYERDDATGAYVPLPLDVAAA
jgi:hypothetical protein